MVEEQQLSHQSARHNESPLPSWERREQIGYFIAIIRTFKEVLWEPAETFRRMPLEGNLRGPFWFAVVPGTISVWATMLWMYLSQSIELSVFAEFGLEPFATFAGENLFGGFMIGMLAIFIVLAPIAVAGGFVLCTATIHILLLMFEAAPKKFETTFRIVCYVYGSSAPLFIIPFTGSLLGFSWGLVCIYYGVREARQTDNWRIIMALLFPGCVYCGFNVLILFSHISWLFMMIKFRGL